MNVADRADRRSANLAGPFRDSISRRKYLVALLVEQKMTLELTEEALEFIAVEGFEPEYGARPLNRAFSEHLQDPLAIELLEGKFAAGDVIRATVSDDSTHLVFEKANT